MQGIHLKQNICAERYFLSVKQVSLRHLIPRHKMSGFIEFRIGRNISFRNKSQYLSVLQYCRHVVELMVFFQRKPHKHQRITALRGIRNRMQSLSRLRKQKFLQEQVTAGIAGNTQFRKYNDPGAFSARLPDSLTNLLCIVYRVSDPDLRGHGRRLDESMFHALYRLSMSLVYCFCLFLPLTILKFLRCNYFL